MAVKYICESCGATMTLGTNVAEVKCPVCRVPMVPDQNGGSGQVGESSPRPPFMRRLTSADLAPPETGIQPEVPAAAREEMPAPEQKLQAAQPAPSIKVARPVEGFVKPGGTAAADAETTAAAGEPAADAKEMGARVQRILDAAHAEADAARAAAKAEAERTLAAAQQQVEQMHAAARADALKTVQEQAVAIVKNARAEAEQITNTARDEAGRTAQAAEQAAAEKLKSAESEVSEAKERARAEALSGAEAEIQKMKKAADDQASAVLAAAQKKAEETVKEAEKKAAERVAPAPAEQGKDSELPAVPAAVSVSEAELRTRKAKIDAHARREARFLMGGMSFSMLVLLYCVFVLMQGKAVAGGVRILSWLILMADIGLFGFLMWIVYGHFTVGKKAVAEFKKRQQGNAGTGDASDGKKAETGTARAAKAASQPTGSRPEKKALATAQKPFSVRQKVGAKAGPEAGQKIPESLKKRAAALQQSGRMSMPHSAASKKDMSNRESGSDQAAGTSGNQTPNNDVAKREE